MQYGLRKASQPPASFLRSPFGRDRQMLLGFPVFSSFLPLRLPIVYRCISPSRSRGTSTWQKARRAKAAQSEAGGAAETRRSGAEIRLRELLPFECVSLWCGKGVGGGEGTRYVTKAKGDANPSESGKNATRLNACVSNSSTHE